MSIRITNVALAGNVWCYEQVCLAEMFKLPKMLLANLLIARVSCWHGKHSRNLILNTNKKNFKKEAMEINKIHHEDCLIGMAKLKDESIDCIITDPPFNSETKMANPFRPDSKAKMSDEEWFIYNNMSARGYNFWFNNVIKEMYRICKTGSHIYIFTNWRSLRNTMDLMEQNFIVLHDVLTWDKEHFGVGFKYRPQTEFIIFGSKGKPKDVNSHSNSNLFRLKRVSKPYSLVQKPVELIDKMILMSSNEGDLILDPFMCSGTTALSAQKNNRNFIGFEINKENFAESQRRLNVGGLFSNSFQTELSNEAGQ